MTRSRVLMIHSSGFGPSQWRKLGGLLATDHDVLAPDLLGYGASGPWPDGAPFHFTQDVEHLAGVLGDDAPAHVVGHSYGGFLALQLALAHPARVRSLAVYEPVAFGVLDEPSADDDAARADLAQLGLDFDGERWLSAFVDWWSGSGAWTALRPEARATFVAVGPKMFQEVATLVADRTTRAGYAAIAAPTLVLGGDRSPLAERRTVAKLAAALPHATLRVFPGLGHMGPLTHAGEVNAAISGFVEEVDHAGR